MSSYQDVISMLTSQGKFYINLGLDRVGAVLNLLDNPQEKLKCIHVAGTNGKGSVCACLSSILSKKYKVGLFTSPHIFEYTERIKINDVEISKEDFANLTEYVVKLADENSVHLTEFEILTVVAFLYFEQNNVDFVVLETGLGGRFDSTNIISSNLCSIIVHIDFDHVERLGDTIEKIATEKAGIIKENSPCFVNSNNLGLDIFKEKVLSCNSELKIVEPLNDNSQILKYSALKGVYQKENLALVEAVITYLNIKGVVVTQEDIENGLKTVQHPCRFQYNEDLNLIVDGGHNPNGIDGLRKSLDTYYPDEKKKIIFGCLKNKNYKTMVKTLFREDDEIYFYHFNNPNSCEVADLISSCPYKAKSFDEFVLDKSKLTVVCGSFYMIKELMEKIIKK
ncbi:MAG: bifunctional folylpolyglutamate synthase/dihydrofolate synthase [bacterium]|nr:bifunctional folylpolyglutamate synthase/dihydrofolate synthase [bacterium]